MVKVKILKTGLVCWARNDIKFWFYCMNYPEDGCFFYDDDTGGQLTCKTKAAYYRYIKLKVLW